MGLQNIGLKPWLKKTRGEVTYIEHRRNKTKESVMGQTEGGVCNFRKSNFEPIFP